MASYTTDAKKALQWAHFEAAVRFQHMEVGPEHLLLGLLSFDGPAAIQLRDRGLTLDRAREAVLARRPFNIDGPFGHLPPTPALGAILQSASHAAGNEPVNSLHLLAALVSATEIDGKDFLGLSVTRSG